MIDSNVASFDYFLRRGDGFVMNEDVPRKWSGALDLYIHLYLYEQNGFSYDDYEVICYECCYHLDEDREDAEYSPAYRYSWPSKQFLTAWTYLDDLSNRMNVKPLMVAFEETVGLNRAVDFPHAICLPSILDTDTVAERFGIDFEDCWSYENVLVLRSPEMATLVKMSGPENVYVDFGRLLGDGRPEYAK